jgi:hypothetical protein
VTFFNFSAYCWERYREAFERFPGWRIGRRERSSRT